MPRDHRGQRNPNAVLTPQLVREVRRMRALGFSLRFLASWLDVSLGCVQRICNGRSWASR